MTKNMHEPKIATGVRSMAEKFKIPLIKCSNGKQGLSTMMNTRLTVRPIHGSM
jgi:hypothetical protein